MRTAIPENDGRSAAERGLLMRRRSPAVRHKTAAFMSRLHGRKGGIFSREIRTKGTARGMEDPGGKTR